MKKYMEMLQQCPLFADISPQNLLAMTSCLGSRVVRYAKGDVIFEEGSPARHMGLLLSGGAQIVKEDFYGKRTIVVRIEPADLFGESFACAGITSLPVSFIASKDCEIMLIDCKRITNTCCNACSFHKQVIFNLLHLVARKNLDFHQKIEITSKRSTKEKLMTYLLSVAKQTGSSSFTIPYDRQALADYLGVERSAMSAEIGKLRKEGIIECQKSHFTIL